MTLRSLAAAIAHELSEAGVPDATFEAELLTRTATGVSRATFFARADVPQEARDSIRLLVDRRLAREPMAYLRGTREFYGLDFEVTPDVLIPRPETELLVDLALSELRQRPQATVVDVGTGSGCIAVAVAKASGARVVATDRSDAALAVARRNATRHDVPLDLVRTNLTDGLVALDIVVANLPYIPSAEVAVLEPEVRDWEPRVALDGGDDGLDAIRALLARCRDARSRAAFLEVGAGQAPTIVGCARQKGATRVQVHRDLAGIERVVEARWE